MQLSFLKPINFEYEVPSVLVREDACKPFMVRPLIDQNYKTAKRRVLVLFQHVPTEDLRAKQLASGSHGKALANMLKLARDYALHSGIELAPSIGYAIANFNYFRTYHLESSDKVAMAQKAERRRVFALLKKFKPHVVLAIGNEVATVLTGLTGTEGKIWAPTYRGYALPAVKNLPFKVIPVHDFTLNTRSAGDEDDDDGDDFGEKKLVAEANLLGYASRCAATLFTKKYKRPFSVPEFECKYVVVDTRKKFDKFFAKLMAAKVTSIDIESNDLARITNRVLTIQFAFSAAKGYIVPIQHAESPWNKKDLEYVRLKLREYFGRTFDPMSLTYDEYIIGQNFKFDMTPLRVWLDLYAIYWPIWDLQAGEYCLDENIKAVGKVAGTPQYNLGQISRNYGITWYDTAKFGKDDRATISARPLDDAVLSYCSVDVQAPFAIHELQLARAGALKFNGKPYTKVFRRFVVTQMNNLIKIESSMEGRGVMVDAPWLRQLQLASGPLEVAKTELAKTMRLSKAAQKANARMMKRKGVPTTSLWGNDQWVLDLKKPDNKQCLFIEVLKLKPLGFGKEGAPSINKDFFKAHKDIPEVATFADMSALEKLGNTYVSKVARIRREDPDMRADGRLRPSFGFTETVTGRSNSYDPNLQQIPSRGKYAKLIKRLFIAAPGNMIVKMDYSAHEIRVWSIISGDEKLGALFAQGRKLRQQWRATEKQKYKDAINTVGDIHKLNCQLFFGTDPREVTAEQRDAVKALIFGSIYGMGTGTLAANLKRDKDFVVELLDKFFSRYTKASAWLKWAKKHVVDHNYVPSPIGRRRNMYAHLYEGAGALEAAVKRMGSNSPIQGWAADMGHTAATLFLYHFPRVVEHLDLFPTINQEMGGINVMVHDSIEGDFKYRLWLVALQVMQWCATTGCMQYYEQHFGTKYTVPLEVEFELGSDDSTLQKWDWSETHLMSIIDTSLENQLKVYPDLKVKDAKKELLWLRSKPKAVAYLDKHYPILA